MPQTTEHTLKAGEALTLPSGDTIELQRTGSHSEGRDTVQTAIVLVTTETE